jgi:hypothetical protein
MNKKIIVIIFIILFISIFFPVVSGIPIPPVDDENNSHIVFNNVYRMFYPDILSNNFDELVVEIIQELDETMYLGYLENITSFGSRFTGTSACHQAGDYIYNEFESMNLEVRYHNWTNGGYQDRNIEGVLHGVNESSDEIYIICAHHDTVSNCPGADDDASGVATVLAAANILSQYDFEHTIIFVTFSGEEQWMLGSEVYAYEAYENGDNIVAVLNVDMIGFAISEYHGDNIKIYYNDDSMWLTSFTGSIGEQYYDYINLNVIPSGFAYSDQYYFWECGYDGLFYHEYEFNYYYHTPDDNLENMNITYATKCSKLVLATLSELAQTSTSNYAPETPAIDGPSSGNAGTEYTYTFNSIDPEDDDIFYYIKWGDGHVEVWDGPYDSGQDVNIAHTYTKQGIYTIEAKAKDNNGLESDWGTFDVTIPRNKVLIKPLLNQLQCHPNLYQLQQKLIPGFII